MMLATTQILKSERIVEFVKFCIVGGSGVVVDMAILCLLADPKFLALNLTFSKICAAEAAMTSNFTWNELWTFRHPPSGSAPRRGLLQRFVLFNAICGVGIGLAVVFLHLFYTALGWNLYVANFLAIFLVAVWNYGMNAGFNWTNRM